MSGGPRPRRWAALLSIALLAPLLPTAQASTAPVEVPTVTDAACAPDVPPASFPDRGPPHGGAIDCLVWHGIAQGLDDGTFGTNTDLVRRQLAVFLARTLNRVAGSQFPEPTAGRFSDVGGSGEIPSSIGALAAFQPPVIEGYADGTFRGGNALTRAQAASFLARAHDQVVAQLGLPPLPTGVVGGFADVHRSDVHAPAIAALDAVGIIQGYPDGTFRPIGTVTRGQLASLLTRLLGIYADAGVLILPGDPTDPADPIDPVDPIDTDVVVRGSLEQVIVYGADPETPIALLGPDGDEVASDALPWEVAGRQLSPGGNTTDVNGSIVFRGSLDAGELAYSGVPAGDGYRVRYIEDDHTVTSAPFEVLEASGASTPDQSFYDDQVLDDGFGYIETRDGTLLSATVILPGPPEEGPYPTIVEYSGYDLSDPPASALNSPGTAIAVSALLGYATVAVNIRGSGCSGGAFDYFETIQGLDGYDVIETVAAQDWSANVGTAGVSYAGISQLFVAATQPPNLAAAAPVAIISDHFRDTVYPGGIYNTGFAREWAEEREEDTAWPGGQSWVEEAIAGEHPRVDADAAATCAENVLTRDQSLPLLDRIEVNDFETSLWVDREPFRFADDITTNLYIAVSSQDEQTGGRAGAILEGLDLDRDDRVVRYSGANGTHVEALSPELLGDLVEFLEFYVAERTPVLTERPNIGELRFALRVVYAGLLGTEGLPSTQQLPLRPDRFAGLTYEDALAAYEAEPPAHILYENGAGLDGFPGFPASSFTHRFEWDELPNLDPDLDVEANTFYLRDGGELTSDAPAETDGEHSSYVYDPDSGNQPTYNFGWERPSNSDVWLLQPDYEWHQPADGEHLSFVTDPLDETAVTYGSASVDLWLDSDLDDTDLEVVLTEIRPDGNEMFVSSGWLRASKRQLEEDASALRPRPTFRAEDAAPLDDGWNEVRVEVFPFGHAFREGSRIRLTIEAPGGNRPLWRFDSTVDGGPTVENRVAHSAALPSKLVLPIVDVEVDVTDDLPGCAPSEDGDGFTAVRAQPCRTAPDLAAPTDVVVRGSVEQVHVTGADPDTPITLYDPAGEPVASDAFEWAVRGTEFVAGGDRTDAVGSIIFRGTLDDTLAYSGVPAGSGYTVEYVEDGETQVSAPVTVLAPDHTPDQALFDGQDLEPGLGYLETRDGTMLSTYVSLPDPDVYGPGPYPTLIEYSGYDVTAPPEPGGLPINIQAPTLALGQLLGYATVAVNIRGSGCSGGAFDYFELLQSLDGYDAVETVAAQAWSENVGMVGVSYPGIAQLFVGSTQPPNLAAMVPVSFISDPARDTIYPGGMFNTGFAFEWAEEREIDTRYPGGQGWVDRITQEDGPAADQCRENVKLRQQNLPLIDRVEANTDRNPLWDTRSPYSFGEDLTTNMLLVNSWQDEQTGGRAAALLDALDTDADDTIRFVGTNGTHTELFGPAILADMIEFLELYVAERTPQLRSRPDWNQIRFVMPLLYREVYGDGIPSDIGDLVPADRFTGMAFEDALAAYESEPPARILFESGAGDGPDGFPFPRFDHRFEWTELPNLDDGFDADAASWYLTEEGLDAAGPGEADTSTSYTYDPDPSQRPYSFASRPGNSAIWRLQPDYWWTEPPADRHASFESEPLEADTVLVGSASVDLWLSTDNPERDTDLEVVLSEVRPDGSEMYLTAGWLRASRRVLDDQATALRPRPSYEAADRAQLPEDGAAELVRVEVFPFGHVVREGSRIRVTVEEPGGNRPIWRFDDLVPGGPDVTNTILHDAEHPSRLVLPVVDGVDVDVPAGVPSCEGSGGQTTVRGQPCRVSSAG